MCEGRAGRAWEGGDSTGKMGWAESPSPKVGVGGIRREEIEGQKEGALRGWAGETSPLRKRGEVERRSLGCRAWEEGSFEGPGQGA